MPERPFLEVLTRCYRRPTMLAINRESLEQQTCSDWMQTLLIDDEGGGVGASYDALASQTVTGEYIWILDDDDMCIYPELVQELKTVAVTDDPDVIMLRMDHGPMGVKPSDRFWGKPPQRGQIGCSAFVTRRQTWEQHRAAMTPGSYTSDYSFIASVFEAEPRIYWHDVIGSQVQRISKGVAE